MPVVDSYPLFTVAHLTASRDFFVQRFGLLVIFEASWVVMLGHASGAIALGLMSAEHPSRPPGPEIFSGVGAIVTLQVDDARAEHVRLLAAGVPVLHPLTDEAWGQRRCMVRDPSGILVDVVEQIEPAAGFWERYSS